MHRDAQGCTTKCPPTKVVAAIATTLYGGVVHQNMVGFLVVGSFW